MKSNRFTFKKTSQWLLATCIAAVVLLTSFTQAGKVSGKLVDSDGKPMASVNVSLLRTQKTVPFAVGTTTGKDGQFSIPSSKEGYYFLQFANGDSKMETDSFYVSGPQASVDMGTVHFKKGR